MNTLKCLKLMKTKRTRHTKLPERKELLLAEVRLPDISTSGEICLISTLIDLS